MMWSAAAVYAPILFTIPVKAEAANLAVFLDSPDAGTAPVTRQWRPLLIVTAVLKVGVPMVAFAQVQLTDIDFDLAALGRRLAKYAAICLAAFVVGRIYASFPYPKDRARWVSVGKRGVRFGWRRPIPWADVTDVTVVGPDPDDPDDRGGMVWTLRKGVVIRAPLHASRRTPEELSLTARSHMEAATC